MTELNSTAAAPLRGVPSIADAREKRLRAMWAKVDRLKAELRQAEADARKQEREVARSLGYIVPLSREKLAVAMDRGR